MQNILSYSTKQDDIIQVGLQFNFTSLQFIYLKNLEKAIDIHLVT